MGGALNADTKPSLPYCLTNATSPPPPKLHSLALCPFLLWGFRSYSVPDLTFPSLLRVLSRTPRPVLCQSFFFFFCFRPLLPPLLLYTKLPRCEGQQILLTLLLTSTVSPSRRCRINLNTTSFRVSGSSNVQPVRPETALYIQRSRVLSTPSPILSRCWYLSPIGIHLIIHIVIHQHQPFTYRWASAPCQPLLTDSQCVPREIVTTFLHTKLLEQ